MKVRVVLFICLSLIVSGCFVSQIPKFEDYSSQVIGTPVNDLRERSNRPQSYASRIGWQENTYNLSDGNWVYVSPVRPDCIVHWMVNKEGIIYDYKTEGERCY